MIHSRHLAPLLLGSLLAGCSDASSFDIEEEAKPPEAVVRSVARVWPGGGFAEDPSMETEGQRVLDLRCRQH